MMGPRQVAQGALFYEFSMENHALGERGVPAPDVHAADHLQPRPVAVMRGTALIVLLALDANIGTQLEAFRTRKREHVIMSQIAAGMSNEEIRAVADRYTAVELEIGAADWLPPVRSASAVFARVAQAAEAGGPVLVSAGPVYARVWTDFLTTTPCLAENAC